VVKHWLSHTPSITLASAKARSVVVVPFRSVTPKLIECALEHGLQPGERVRVLVHAATAILSFQRPYGTVLSQSAQTDP
jgi:hypothetical protein